MVDYLQNREYYAIFWEMRVGKSPTILTHLRNLYKRGLCKKFFILAPPSAIPDWLEHIQHWFPEMLMCCYSGNKEVFNVWNRQTEGLYLCSSALVTGNSKKTRTRIRAKDFRDCDVAVIDESHYIKNYKAGRTSFALSLSKVAKYRYALTGTPIGGSEVDYYTQMKFLHPDIFDDMSLTEFRRTYFYQTFDQSPQGDFDEDYREDFEKRLRSASSSLRLADVREFLPEDTSVPIEIEASGEQLDMIEKLRQDFLVEYEDKEITAVNAGAEIMKISQILNGHCKTETGQINLKENPKLAWFKANIRSLVRKEKAIVWTNFKQDYRNVKDALDQLGIPYMHYKSGMTPAQRQKKIEIFRRDPDLRVFIAHPDSAGTGVNLSVAPVMVFYSRNYNWLSHAQAASRNKTIDSGNLVTYHLFIKDSLDEEIVKRLESKGANSAKNMAALLFEEFLHGKAKTT